MALNRISIHIKQKLTELKREIDKPTVAARDFKILSNSLRVLAKKKIQWRYTVSERYYESP